jgi:PAS domain S-box-containing protein
MGWRDQAEAYRKDDRQTIESGDSRLNMEEPQTTPDGKTITLLTNKIPLRNSKGEISGVLGTYMDITARKRAEEALRQSEERFAGAFEHAPIGVALVSPDGRWLKVNHALCELVGYSEAELLTRTFQDLTPPGDLADDLEHVRRIIAGEIHSYQIEKRYVHARGHLITTLLSVSLVRDGRGQPLYFISQIQDITDRKRAEETLRKTEARLAHAMSLAQLFAWEYDMASGLFTFSNRYYVLHGTTAEQEGGNLMSAPDFVRRFVHPEDAHLIAEEVGKAAATTDPNYRAQLECRVFRRDRELRYVLVNIAVTKDAAGKTIKLNGANQDITELKQAEANLEKINNELVVASRLAGMAEVATSVLHNVGNVLNSVGVSATLVANQVRHTKAVNIAKVAALFDQHQADLAGFLATDPRGQTLPAYLGSLAESIAAEQATLLAELAYLRKNIEHIKDIVAMQQAYAQISGGTVTVSIPDLLEEALRINADALARYDVTTIRDYQARPVIATDKHKVLQILINLVRNAELACVDSGRTDKQITVRTTSDDHSVKIAIVDNGVGIPAENLTRIFNHGFTTRKTGHGFALHSGALAARELGGALTVQSDGAGLGATFTLELPYQPDTPAHENSVR